MYYPIKRLRAAGCRVSTREGHDSHRLRFHYGIRLPEGVRLPRDAVGLTLVVGSCYAFRDKCDPTLIVAAGQGVGAVGDITEILNELADVMEGK